MNKLRYLVSFKVFAWLLGSLAVVALTVSAYLAIFLADAGAYDQTPVASDRLYYRTSQARQFYGLQAMDFYEMFFASKVFIPAQEAAGRTVDTDWKQEMERAFSLLENQQAGASSWTILDEAGEVVWTSQADRTVLVTLTHSAYANLYSLYEAAYGNWPDSKAEADLQPLDQDWLIQTNIHALEPADAQQRSWYLSVWRLGQYRELLSVAPFVFLLLTGLAMAWLFWSAGCRKETEGVHLTWYDRTPLELLILVYVLLLALVISALNAYFFAYRPIDLDQANTLQIAAACFLLWILSILILRFLVSLAVRVKAGQFWRRTLLGLLLRLAGWILARLPLLWQSLLIMGGVVIIELFFIAGFSSSFPNPTLLALLFLIYHAALICLVCLLIIQLDKLREAGRRLAEGDLDYKVNEAQLFGAMRRHGEQLNSIRQGMARAVEARMKSERFKTELITNVSHDIKTPLTSIINYVDLLKSRPIDDPAAREYIGVIDRQSARLKKLAEDIVSASKAATGAVPVQTEPTDLVELLAQTAEEYTDRLAQARLTLISHLPAQASIALTDGKLLWRVLDNLFQNACKYAQPDTRVYLDLQKTADTHVIVLRNISREPLNINSEELFERFIRGDAARTGDGSGLGLAIARSLTELLGGKLELDIDGDLFKAILTLPGQESPAKVQASELAAVPEIAVADSEHVS